MWDGMSSRHSSMSSQRSRHNRPSWYHTYLVMAMVRSQSFNKHVQRFKLQVETKMIQWLKRKFYVKKGFWTLWTSWVSDCWISEMYDKHYHYGVQNSTFPRFKDPWNLPWNLLEVSRDLLMRFLWGLKRVLQNRFSTRCRTLGYYRCPSLSSVLSNNQKSLQMKIVKLFWSSFFGFFLLRRLKTSCL